ncbi:N-acetylmuramoyl-L-alanine amidase [Bacillus lacus]|uniref:N-acetylmuramoyl-L-alanine amidase n=1 Tax=Metabacillus lacus TaxID=1983721 RepID=A0A7X2LYP0_9BACI|nr:N-acetylmuramoyl-L-alanine amidase [Metabacillus lacus]MRX70834.1 N-acetylmuramoyl-L-alanine amidase [Metabacillus lacus]
MKIILDAGHGYNTPGKRTPDGSMREWEFNSRVTEIAKGMLEQYEDVQVQFSHDPTGKIDIPLGKRTEHANRWGADVVVSVHANAFGEGGWHNAEGVETFVHTSPSEQSLRIANAIHKRLVAQTGLRDRGVKKASFHMVREAKMPSVLPECGFMTNRNEAALLKTEPYRLSCAVAIVEGLVEVYKLKRKREVKGVSITPTKSVIKLTNPQKNAVTFLENKGIVKKGYAEEIYDESQVLLISTLTQLIKKIESGEIKAR